MTTNNINEAAHGYPSSWSTDRNGKRWEDYDTILCPDGYVVDMQHLLDEQARAAAALTHLAPAFGGLISKLRQVYTFRFTTQATDGYNLFINPEFTDKLDFTGKVFVMAHEVMHCLLNHMRRGASDDPDKSNIAADHEVNITLSELGLFKISTMEKLKAYVDKKYTDWSYERIYQDITSGSSSSMDNSKQGQQAPNGQNQGGKGQQGQQGQGSGKGQQGQQGQGSGSGSGDGNSQPHSGEFKDGWKRAIEDYNAGRLKL